MDSYFYLEARGNNQLDRNIIAEIDDLIKTFNDKPEIRELVEKGEGELFFINQYNQGEILLTTKVLLPSALFETEIDDFIYVVENWTNLASVMRNRIKVKCKWKASIDYLVLAWDTKQKKYKIPSLSK